MPSRKLTRRELYDLVWASPMTKLANDFGISDVGLKKTCDRHRVPTPPRGYWAKLEAGQKPKKAVFVEVDDARLNQIDVGAGGHDLPEPVRQIIAERKAERKEAIARQRAVKPIDYDPIVDVHPTVRKTAAALRKCKPSATDIDASGEGLCGARVGRESIERAVYVLDAMARQLAERGMPLAPTGQAMKVAIGSDEAILVLKERTRLIDHEPSAEEIAAEARRVAQRERYWANPGRWAYPSYERAYPEKDTLWTGELFVQIEGYGDGVRRKWADGRTQRLEEMVPSIVDGIQILLAARKAQREEREERARQWAEQERRRGLARARHEREKARMSFFENLVRLRRDANDLKAALSSLEITDADPEAQIARMMAWGRTRLQQMEEHLQSDRIEERLSEAKLFPAEGFDELHDPLAEPPSRW